MKITSRERMQRCFEHEELDRPGVYFRTGYPQDDPTYDRVRAYIEANTELKRGMSLPGLETPPSIETHTEPHSEDFQRVVSTLHTPAGDLEASFLESLKGLPGLGETFYIKSRRDAETYLSLPMSRMVGDVEPLLAAGRELGDRGILDIGVGFNPGGHVVDLCGSETFAMMSVTDRDILHSICERELRIVLGRLKYALVNGLGPFFSTLGQEYVVPPMHSPKDFHDFNTKYDRPIFDAIHDAGGRVHVHCHGSIRRVFGEFLDVGVDVLHPFEAPPLGDITAAEAKRLARGRMCLEGNVQIAEMYEKTPDQIREQTESLIADAFDDRRGLIVCPTASLYVRGEGERCFPQVKAMVETVLRCES